MFSQKLLSFYQLKRQISSVTLHDGKVYTTQGEFFEQFFSVITTKILAFFKANICSKFRSHFFCFDITACCKHINVHSVLNGIQHVFKASAVETFYHLLSLAQFFNCVICCRKWLWFSADRICSVDY